MTPATIEAKAGKFERTADAIVARLPKSAFFEPAVLDANAVGLSPDDPRWGRWAVDRMRASADRRREFRTP